MNAQLAGFRVALGIVFFGTIIAFAIIGLMTGMVSAASVRGPVSIGALFGAAIGGGIGWLFASYACGIGYTLLSINDHLAAMSGRNEESFAVPPGMPEPATATAPGSSSTSTAAPDTRPWRERLETLPVDQSIQIKGLVVWKIKDGSGRIYFSGDRSYYDIDELMRSYRIQ